MPIGPEPGSETERIRSVYAARDRQGKKTLYGWQKQNVRYFDSCRERLFSSGLYFAFGEDLSEVRVLDVGCGSGAFLRKLVEWGAVPARLTGTELLQDRLDIARRKSPAEIDWRLGDLDFAADESFDLVCAHTVLSSVLTDNERSALAEQMISKLKPGGWIMVFDFRYDNPSNPDVRKVARSQLRDWWPGTRQYYRTGLLAPPLARRLVGSSWLLAELLTTVFPPLRSHFIYLVQKPDLRNGN